MIPVHQSVIRLLTACVALVLVPSMAGAQTQPAQTSNDLLWRTESSRLFSSGDVRVGLDQNGDPTLAGRGRFFAPFGSRSAVQIQGRYDWYEGSREGQFDIALVNRVRRVQLGVFSSVRYISLDGYERGRALSQAGATFDYLFDTGRIGAFATFGLRDFASVDADRQLSRLSFYSETYLSLVDQFGAAGRVDVRGRFQVDGHLAILDPAGTKRTTAGALRLAYPVAPGWAVTAEGAWNSSRISSSIQTRFTVGLRVGQWPSARNAIPANTTPGTAGAAADLGPVRPTPVEIPAIRYEALTRTERDGNRPPFVDAGPDQVITLDCADQDPCLVTVKLDSTGTIDPEGDALTYQWTPRTGFTTEVIQPANQPSATFQGAADRTYIVRLTVTDAFGAFAVDDVTITIVKRPK